MTEFGLSMEAPVIVLTDGQANPVYYGGEFFEMAEIGRLLKDVLEQ